MLTFTYRLANVCFFISILSLIGYSIWSWLAEVPFPSASIEKWVYWIFGFGLIRVLLEIFGRDKLKKAR